MYLSGIHLVPEAVDSIGIDKFAAGPAVEDGGSVAVLGNENVVIACGLDGEHIDLRVYLLTVGIDELSHIYMSREVIRLVGKACLPVLPNALWGTVKTAMTSLLIGVDEDVVIDDPLLHSIPEENPDAILGAAAHIAAAFWWEWQESNLHDTG